MGRDALDDFDRLFDLPEKIVDLSKKIDSMERTIRAADPGSVSVAIGNAFKDSSKEFFWPVLRALDGANLAATKLDEVRDRMPFRRRLLIALLTTAAALAIFVGGAALGQSRGLTAAALQTSAGCKIFGGEWVVDKRVRFCAFRVS